MKKPLTKYCPFHGKMEPVDNFYKNASNEDGLADQCKKASNKFTDRYEDEHRDAINEKAIVNTKYNKGKISKLQKVKMITEINDRYGLRTRVK